MAKRVYEVWKGRNIFFLGGRVIFGPDARSLFFTQLLLIAPVVIFCNFVARHLLHKFSSYNAGFAFLVVPIVFTIHVLVLLFLTSARDPGIVPRNSHPNSSAENGGRHTPTLQIPRLEVMVNGLPVWVKYCETCMLYRPPRCSHCSICDNCVERYDHNCPWVGQCIGLRNYRFFFCFVSYVALLCIYVFAMCALYIKFLMDDDGTVWKAMKKSPASVVLMGYCFVGGLTGFHSYLISKNQTTHEYFRYRSDNRINYDLGCWSNFSQVFCTKLQPSRNNFCSFAQEEAPMTSLPTMRQTEVADTGDNRREKMDDDQLDLGRDLLNISQWHNVDDIESDICSRGSDRPQLHTNQAGE